MMPRPPGSNRTVTLFPYTTHFRSRPAAAARSPCSCRREIRDLSGRQAFLGQQHRDAVAAAVDDLAVAGDQRLAQRLGLGRVVRARDAAAGDGAVQGVAAGLAAPPNWLAGAWAGDVFTHSFFT